MEVTRATGQHITRTLDDPYALTLYQYVILLDLRRVEQVVSEGDRLDLAGLVHYAFNAPLELRKRTLDYQSRLGVLQDTETVLERAKRMMADIARLDAQHGHLLARTTDH